MKNFEYEAMVCNGENKTGIITAEDQRDAIKRIRDKGMFPVKVREVKPEVKPEVETEEDFFEYLAGVFGKQLISWGKYLTGEK